MSDKNPRYGIDSNRIYTVFLLIADGQANTNNEISEILDLSPGTVGDSLNSLEEHGVIEKGEQGRSQPYEYSLEGLVSVFEDVWDLDSTPSEFEGFLEEYVSAYVGFEASSSIRGMLRDDFAEALLSYQRDHDLPEWLQSLRSDLSGELEAYRPKEDYIEKALD
ncbi:MAG: winged helix-turn-helix domain-containing protein [Candidatus Nanohaloarchaea archaeon]